MQFRSISTRNRVFKPISYTLLCLHQQQLWGTWNYSIFLCASDIVTRRLLHDFEKLTIFVCFTTESYPLSLECKKKNSQISTRLDLWMNQSLISLKWRIYGRQWINLNRYSLKLNNGSHTATWWRTYRIAKLTAINECCQIKLPAAAFPNVMENRRGRCLCNVLRLGFPYREANHFNLNRSYHSKINK